MVGGLGTGKAILGELDGITDPPGDRSDHARTRSGSSERSAPPVLSRLPGSAVEREVMLMSGSVEGREKVPPSRCVPPM